MDKGGGDNGVAGGAVVDDMGESMQCSNHPYKTNPGGICAFCLQEKLGKLLSSSQSNASFFPSSASPSFRSDNGNGGNGNGVLGGLSFGNNNTSSSSSIPSSSTSSAKKKLKKVVASNNNNTNLVLMRSKSSSSGPVPIRRHPHHHHHHHLFDGDEYTPRKGGFWSFLHISSRKHHRDHKTKGESKPSVHPATINTHTPAAGVKEKSLGVGESSSSRKVDYGDENESPNSSHASSSSFGRKVARSRSVGCGSRSFSGDLLERISTGFGDCTLRRVESQREAKQPKGVGMRGGGRGMGEHHHRIKERVKCGGIFGGFSSSSSSSSHWASSSEEVNHQSNESRRDVVGGIEHRSNSIQPHSRHKSWGWAFASPMRAFKSSKPEEKIVANGNAVTVTNNANAPAPNLAAIPSLLTVRS